VTMGSNRSLTISSELFTEPDVTVTNYNSAMTGDRKILGRHRGIGG
jgi:hypothetical protein